MSGIEWLFRDRRSGELVLAQPPNLPGIILTSAAIVHWLLPEDTAGRVARPVSTAALAWWGTDELLRGVNPARRLLGAAALVVLTARAIR